ncbi:hypothetical protein SUGI_0692440 [Cryptomeria japonica]|nr:hypothetical protein SUGI_0692440 [Cryptomeria japonica]
MMNEGYAAKAASQLNNGLDSVTTNGEIQEDSSLIKGLREDSYIVAKTSDETHPFNIIHFALKSLVCTGMGNLHPSCRCRDASRPNYLSKIKQPSNH